MNKNTLILFLSIKRNNYKYEKENNIGGIFSYISHIVSLWK
ncbi:hypothetical protein STRUR_1444 [Streptococcus urinalis 2285-97]|uniref:Uncharacterized protein n=1 Tax=Streptococcus urinalis 2285-97 TaxID=764291 RepID=G5KHD0_9STRE|nr:hypothetical protein STRUR_1444 [Streptococcus urinalis 2285-97]